MTDTDLTPEKTQSITTAAVDPASATLPAPAPPPAAPPAGGLQPAHYDASGFLCGSIFTPEGPPPPPSAPRGRTPEPPIPAFRATGEQMAALLPPKRPAPEQPDAAGWLASVTGTPDIVRGQQPLVPLTLTGGPALAAELTAERQRRTAAASAKLNAAGNTPAAGAALVAELTRASDEARRRLNEHLNTPEVRALLCEVLLSQLSATEALTLRSRCRN